MMRSYRQLDLDERRGLVRLVEARVPVALIAQLLRRYRSTIHREIGRNGVHAYDSRLRVIHHPHSP